MADEQVAADTPPEVDIEAVESLPAEELSKIQRGEAEPPRKGTKPEGEGGEKQDFVPHEQFHRTNERRKEAEAERERYRAQNEILMQRMAELLEAAKPKQEQAKSEAEEIPDETADPLAALAWTKQQLRQMQEARQREHQQTEQQRQAERQRREAFEAVQPYFERKVAEKPDLQSMYDGLRTSYAREYAALNPGIPPARVAQMVEQQEAAIIQWAYRNQYPIDAVIEQLAVSRGVQAKAPDAKPGQDQARDAMGRFTAAAAEMDRRDATRKAAMSLNGGGSQGDVTELTPQMIADMSPEEFSAFKAKWGSISNFLARH